MKVIELIVTPDGKSNVQTKGFAGSECRAASRYIEEALGLQVNEQLTSEFYASSNEQQRLRDRN